MDSIDLPIVGTFLWLAGLCVGSFLNVVIYRLPRDLSVGSPLWSFCPACGSKIAFRDNLPLLSWLLLRGRCRHCAAPISVQYPLVESLTGMLFIVVLYLLFSANSRADLVHLRMPNDIPLLLCWLTLVAVMVVCLSTDIVSYMIDVRVTNLAVALGVVFHTAWPRRTWLSQDALPNGYDLCWLGIGLAAVIWMWITRPRFDEEPDEDAPEEAGQAPTGEAHTAPTTLQVDHEITTAPDVSSGHENAIPTATLEAEAGDVVQAPPTFGWIGLVGMLCFAGAAIWLLVASGYWMRRFSDSVLPVASALSLVFIGIVTAGSFPRPADEEIEHELTSEEQGARKLALGEFGQLLLIVGLGGGLVALLLWLVPGTQGWAQALLQAEPRHEWAPLAGLTFAVKGAIIAAASGWFVRIGFTLAFGREAFGTGDIYILAAAGATVGWDIAVLGLLCAVGLALAGFILGLLLKQTMIIPFGPWLALGFLVALWINKPAAKVFAGYGQSVENMWREQPASLLVMGGILMIGTAFAIALSKLLRRLVEPGAAEEMEPEILAPETPEAERSDIEDHGDSTLGKLE